MLYLFFRLGAKGQAFGSSIANESLAEWHVDSYAGFDARVHEFHSCKSADGKIEPPACTSIGASDMGIWHLAKGDSPSSLSKRQCGLLEALVAAKEMTDTGPP